MNQGDSIVRKATLEPESKPQPTPRPALKPSRVAVDKYALLDQYQAVRKFSESLCETLEPEDFVIQTMPEASPTKWHLAHTSWFFETFVLRPHLPGYHPVHPQYAFLFNSYYNA